MRTDWLSRLRRRAAELTRRDSGRRSARPKRSSRPGRPRPAQAHDIEYLEQRTLLTVQSLLVGNSLTLVSDGADSISVGTQMNNPSIMQVLVNGVDEPSLPVIQASQLESLLIIGSDTENTIDLSGMTAVAYSFTDLFGNPISIEVDGDDGNDTIMGSPDLAATLRGGDGDDTITSGTAGDSAVGGDGDDSLTTGDGNDTVEAGDGNDIVDTGLGDDTVDLDDGDDAVVTGDGNDSVTAGNGMDTVSGGAGNDTLVGDRGQDAIDGGADNDTIFGGADDDTINGGTGDDSIIGNGGEDLITGNTGNDTLQGGNGADTLTGSLDNDLVIGDLGTDAIFGEDGDDTLFGGGGVDEVHGGNGNDIIRGNSGNDTLNGTTGFDDINGGVGNDLIYSATAPDSTPVPIFTALPLSFVSGDGFVADEVPVETKEAAARAIDFLTVAGEEYGLTATDVSNFIVTDAYTTAHNGVSHVWLQQTYQGLPIVDATFNVNVLPSGTVFSANSDFIPDVDSLNLSAAPVLSADDVFATLESEFPEFLQDHRPDDHLVVDVLGDGTGSTLANLQLERTDIPDELEWATDENGDLHLVWTINVEPTNTIGWYDVSVSAMTGEVIDSASWVNFASYNVLRYDVESPLLGTRSVEVDPQDAVASPFGWHDTDGAMGAEFTDTRGNNVFAQPGRDEDPFPGTPIGTGPRPDGGAALDFDFAFDATQAPSNWTDTATVNLFYANNIIHDILYHYGFDEVSGNFQENNYGNGGMESDNVIANAQYGADNGVFNNAFMATGPDGQNPTMGMFEFSLTNPNRDSDMENTIIFHEFGHGVTNRLTGGPANAGALQDAQSRGMGEGWSDLFALMLTMEAGDQGVDPRPQGNWVLGQPVTGGGVRTFPYSTDMNINPLTFGDLNTRLQNAAPHDDGEVWVSAVWDMTWNLIDGVSGAGTNCSLPDVPAYGLDLDWYNGTGGNNIAMQLMMDALKLQPANPTFIEARDAILQADMMNNGGANALAIWTAFAGRGMGFSASAGADATSTSVVEAFDLPPDMASIMFDMQTYMIGDTVGLSLCDSDEAMGGTPTLDVTVGTSIGDSETVTLTLQPSQLYTGTIPLASGAASAGNGSLEETATNGMLTASFVDMTNGTGMTVTVTANAAVSGTGGGGGPVTPPPAELDGDTLFGSDGNDTIFGSGGDEFIVGGLGDDSVQASDGNDRILGGGGNDTLDGEAGDDTINGQGGDDLLIGGSGNDEIIWRGEMDGMDTAPAGDGADTLSVNLSSASNTVTISQQGSSIVINENGQFVVTEGNGFAAGFENVTINAGAGDDDITIQDLNNVGAAVLTVNGDDGDDTMTGFGSNPGSVRIRLNGNDGNDGIVGTIGNDTISGDAGNDQISGDEGDDLLLGGSENDYIRGFGGNDVGDGGTGNDTLDGEAGDDSLSGGLDDDFFDGGDGNDTLNGGFGNDNLLGNHGDDLVMGGPGQDTLLGAIGNDTLDGGRNNDVLLGHSGHDKLRGDHGNDFIRGHNGNDTIDGGDGDDIIRGEAGRDGIVGGDGDDFIDAGIEQDTVVGGDGDDMLFGGGSNDIVIGDDGDDTIRGNSGNDILQGNEGANNFAASELGEVDEAFMLTVQMLENLDASN